MKAEQAGVQTGSKMIAVRDRNRIDLIHRVENMSSCMPSIKGMVPDFTAVTISKLEIPINDTKVDTKKGFIKGIMIPYLENLTGEKWILLKDKLFFHWPDKKSDIRGAKDGIPVHQDLFCYDFDMVSLD